MFSATALCWLEDMASSTCLHTLHAYCAAYKRPNLHTFTPEELGLNNLESLRLYQSLPPGCLRSTCTAAQDKPESHFNF